jgi:hypothetical protein
MTLLRGRVILAAAAPGIEPRWQIVTTGIQLCKSPPWAKKPFYLRNPPIHAVNPSPAQKQVRATLGSLASAKKGSKGFENGLPVVAAAVKAGLKGKKATAPTRRLRKPYVYDKYAAEVGTL